MKVYAFDFDGTLTTKDTFVEFIEFNFGYKKAFWGFLLFSPLLVLMKLKMYPNWKAKQRVFSWFFKGMNIDEFDEKCVKFAQARCRILRPDGIGTLRKAFKDGDKAVIISASIENWVRPFFAEFGDLLPIEGTQIDVRNDVVTGKFISKNCYGEEKVDRLKKVFPNRFSYQLIVFGDSNGDKALLAEADEAHYRPFRNGKREKLGEIVRFGIVGVAATALQFCIYVFLLNYLEPRISNTIGYALSFCFNYVASTKFTFKVKSTAKRGAGFALSHIVNFLLQTAMLSLFLYLGFEKRVAMIPVFCVCVPVNFLLVRMFMKRK